MVATFFQRHRRRSPLHVIFPAGAVFYFSFRSKLPCYSPFRFAMIVLSSFLFLTQSEFHIHFQASLSLFFFAFEFNVLTPPTLLSPLRITEVCAALAKFSFAGRSFDGNYLA